MNVFFDVTVQWHRKMFYTIREANNSGRVNQGVWGHHTFSCELAS